MCRKQLLEMTGLHFVVFSKGRNAPKSRKLKLRAVITLNTFRRVFYTFRIDYFVQFARYSRRTQLENIQNLNQHY